MSERSSDPVQQSQELEPVWSLNFFVVRGLKVAIGQCDQKEQTFAIWVPFLGTKGNIFWPQSRLKFGLIFGRIIVSQIE